MIHVCSLSKLHETVAASQGAHLISLLIAGTAITRPPSIEERNHLLLGLHDIAEAREGMTPPGEEHVLAILDFAERWDRKRPLVVNCYAGISRSTAAAYIVAAARAPGRDERELAQSLRRASPSATPNPRLIALADAVLRREGRMIEAVREIGRGADAFEGAPFSFAVDAR